MPGRMKSSKKKSRGEKKQEEGEVGRGGKKSRGRSVKRQRADVPSPVCQFVSRERCCMLS